MSISELRREYNVTGLRRKDLEAEPLIQFHRWFNQAAAARASGRFRKLFVNLYKSVVLGAIPVDVNAMTLATADKQGRPSARVVLLKGVDERGFLFFTNYDSRKGRELAENPRAALVFYWHQLHRQVRVRGRISKLPAADSDAYSATPPPASRIAAAASRQ